MVGPLLVAEATYAGPPAVPDYEVKFFLVPDRALDADGHPAKDVRRGLDIKKGSRKLRMQFIDGKKPQLHPQGWDVRLRKKEGEDDFELTYKRRYPVGDDGLDAALSRAAKEGFGRGEKGYDAQVEWGSKRRTLTFSREKAVGRGGHRGMDLPGLEESRKACTREVPGKLDRWVRPGWARGVLADARLYGPVEGKRWEGAWGETKVDFEVWQVRKESGKGTEPVVELSFKEKDPVKAGRRRDELTRFLNKRGWLLPEDVLKTELILKRY